ncbi:MAG: nucleotidyltransferase domain-containing protein [Candidatus Paceibacteria bacterium]
MTQKTKQPKIEEDVLDRIVKKIKTEYSPDQIILFGSYARGNPDPDSDLDLLIIKDTEKPQRKRQQELRKKIYPPEAPFDLIVLTPDEVKRKRKSGVFINNILNKGRKIYEK